jgi:chromosome segregation ATPase
MSKITELALTIFFPIMGSIFVFWLQDRTSLMRLRSDGQQAQQRAFALLERDMEALRKVTDTISATLSDINESLVAIRERIARLESRP